MRVTLQIIRLKPNQIENKRIERMRHGDVNVGGFCQKQKQFDVKHSKLITRYVINRLNRLRT